MSNKTVLITGCSSGFGKLTAKLFQQKGWNVIATMRSPEKETELNQLSNVLLLKLDVTDSQSVKEAVAAGQKEFNRIDVLVNNAGKSGEAVFEQFDEASVNSMFGTNILGLIRVTQEVLPTMRKQGEGVVINLSSGAGLVASPCSSIYSATKFAVEGLTQALAVEYSPFNIRFKVIAPGAYETNLVASADRGLLENGDDQIREYSAKLANQLDAIVAGMRSQSGTESNPQEVAEKVFECATEQTPVHNVCGVDAEGILQMRKNLSEDELIKTLSDMFKLG